MARCESNNDAHSLRLITLVHVYTVHVCVLGYKVITLALFFQKKQIKCKLTRVWFQFVPQSRSATRGAFKNIKGTDYLF